MSRTRPLIAALLFALACGDDDAGSPDMAAASDLGPPPPPTRIGPDAREARVTLPNDYDPEASYPVVMLLHGYGATGLVQGAYFGIPRLARELGFIAIIPDGTADSDGNQFWNATDVCCTLDPSAPDDVAYLSALIDEALATYAADPDRVTLIGHSNGGFMAYRMACDASETIAGLVSLAGATWNDPAECGDPAEPVSVLQIHGTADDTIRYEGGDFRTGTHPSARESVQRFAERSGCAGTWMDRDPIDFVTTVDGAETKVEVQSTGCAVGTDYQLWTVEGGGHIPSLAEGAIQTALEWLLAQ